MRGVTNEPIALGCSRGSAAGRRWAERLTVLLCVLLVGCAPVNDPSAGVSVEWEIPVYEVGFVEGRFEVTSRTIPTANRAEAVPVLRVMAWVTTTSDSDRELLMRVKTDDTIRIRGVVQEIRTRTIMAVVPAVLVGRQR